MPINACTYFTGKPVKIHTSNTCKCIQNSFPKVSSLIAMAGQQHDLRICDLETSVIHC